MNYHFYDVMLDLKKGMWRDFVRTKEKWNRREVKGIKKKPILENKTDLLRRVIGRSAHKKLKPENQ